MLKRGDKVRPAHAVKGFTVVDAIYPDYYLEDALGAIQRFSQDDIDDKISRGIYVLDSSSGDVMSIGDRFTVEHDPDDEIHTVVKAEYSIHGSKYVVLGPDGSETTWTEASVKHFLDNGYLRLVPKEAEKSTQPLPSKETKCTCKSSDLFNFGCKCGHL